MKSKLLRQIKKDGPLIPLTAPVVRMISDASIILWWYVLDSPKRDSDQNLLRIYMYRTSFTRTMCGAVLKAILQLNALLNLFTFIKWHFAGRSAVVQIKNSLHKTSFSLTVTIIPFYSKFFKLERSGLPKVLIKGLLSPNHNPQI